MKAAEKTGTVDRITALGEQAVAGTSIELVEVQLRGAGRAQLLRVYIYKPEGVTHGDCELISERLGKLLDEDEAILGEGYTLEVSSPGVERKLAKPRDFERVVGQKVKVALSRPIAGQTRFEGKLKEFAAGVLSLEVGSGEHLQVPLDQVQKANLKFEW